MSSLNWNALWIAATAALICVLPFVSVPPIRPRAALLYVRSATRKNRRRLPGDGR